MSQQHRDRDELLAEVRALADAYIDGSLDEAQQTRLQKLIAHDDEARELYIAYVQETFDLVQATRTIAANDDVLANPRAASRFVAHLRAMPLARRRRLISTAAAAIVVGVFLTTMAYITVPLYRAMMGSPNDSQPSREIVAQLTTSRDAVWADGQISKHDGAFLPMGHRMDLKRGQVVVTHRNGAVVTLDGPCFYIVQDVSAGTLELGRLVATVPPAAIGFRVATGQTTITDLGTEFGVDVDELGSFSVHVMTGRVRVAPRMGQRRETRELVAGQALRFDGRWHSLATSAADRYRFRVLAQTADIQVIRGVTIHDVSSELTDTPFDRRAEHLVDESGLSQGGHSAFPDIASHGDHVGNMWLTKGTYREPHDPPPAHVTFDLGDDYELAGIFVWNYNEQKYALHSRGAREVEISVSATVDPPQFVKLQTSVGGFVFPRADGTVNYRGFPVDLDAISDPSPLSHVRLVRIEIQSNHTSNSDDQCVGLSEVRFFGRTAAAAQADQKPNEVLQQ